MEVYCFELHQLQPADLLSSGRYEFRKVWERSTEGRPTYLGAGMVLMDDGQTLCGGYQGSCFQPVEYSLVDILHAKVLSGLLSTWYPASVRDGAYDGHSSNILYALTERTMVVIDVNARSVILETRVFQEEQISLGFLKWMCPERTFLVQSCSRSLSQVHGLENVLSRIAVFTVLPVKFVCMVDITRQAGYTALRTRKVNEPSLVLEWMQVFGMDAVTAYYRENVLMVRHPSEIRIYDFDEVTERCQEASQLVSNIHDVNSPRTGFRPNITLTECPACLLRVEGIWDTFQFGFHHYLYSARNTKVNIIASPHQEHIIERGMKLQKCTDSNESVTLGRSHTQIRIFFHPDNSRLIDKEKRDIITHCYTIHFGADHRNLHLSDTFQRISTNTISSSSKLKSCERQGRQPVTISRAETDGIFYIDEEEVLLALGRCKVAGQGMKALIAFYDDTTGRRLRSMMFDDWSPTYYDQVVEMDHDTLIRSITRTCVGSNSHVCQMYRLFGQVQHDATTDGNPGR